MVRRAAFIFCNAFSTVGLVWMDGEPKIESGVLRIGAREDMKRLGDALRRRESLFVGVMTVRVS